MLSRVWLVLLSFAFTPVQGAIKPDGETVKLGFFMSITGRDASFGEAALRGARLAIDDLNAAGGILAARSSWWSKTIVRSPASPPPR